MLHWQSNARSSSLLVLLSIASVASAQSHPSLNADPISMARIVVYSIFFAIFIVFTFFALLAAVTLRGHRTPYSLLALTTFLISIELATHVVELVLSNLTAPYKPSLRTIGAVVSLNAFSGYWSWLTLFMTVVILLHDRMKSCKELTGKSREISQAALAFQGEHYSRSKGFMVVHSGLATLILALGTASAALITKLNDDRLNGRIETVRQFLARVSMSGRVFYAFNSFVIMTAVDVIALSFYGFKGMKHYGVSDKIFSTLIRISVPSYVVLLMNRTIFMILFSPARIDHSTGNGHVAFDRATLANAITNQVLLVCTTAPIVMVGLMKRRWSLGNGNGKLRPKRDNIQHPHLRNVDPEASRQLTGT